LAYLASMSWDVEFTDEFEAWWNKLSEAEQEAVDASVRLLEARGPNLPFPYSSGIALSKHGHMRELRIQHQGRPYRVLYAFDRRRAAILLIGGDKTGDKPPKIIDVVQCCRPLSRHRGNPTDAG